MQSDDRRGSEAYLTARRLLTARDRPPRPLILPLLLQTPNLGPLRATALPWSLNLILAPGACAVEEWRLKVAGTLFSCVPCRGG
jgi:hypothetical protein